MTNEAKDGGAAFTLPTEPVEDRLLKETVTLSDDAIGCGYQGYEFGAHYLDSVCIDGYLWDADSGEAGEEGWLYSIGGDTPCPHCNHASWAEGALESANEDGFQRERSREDCPFPTNVRFVHLGDALRNAWLAGWDESHEGDPA
jgi:ribosome modulation factor